VYVQDTQACVCVCVCVQDTRVLPSARVATAHSGRAESKAASLLDPHHDACVMCVVCDACDDATCVCAGGHVRCCRGSRRGRHPLAALLRRPGHPDRQGTCRVPYTNTPHRCRWLLRLARSSASASTRQPALRPNAFAPATHHAPSRLLTRAQAVAARQLVAAAPSLSGPQAMERAERLAAAAHPGRASIPLHFFRAATKEEMAGAG
jgi:hypothetical protein